MSKVEDIREDDLIQSNTNQNNQQNIRLLAQPHGHHSESLINLTFNEEQGGQSMIQQGEKLYSFEQFLNVSKVQLDESFKSNKSIQDQKTTIKSFNFNSICVSQNSINSKSEIDASGDFNSSNWDLNNMDKKRDQPKQTNQNINKKAKNNDFKQKQIGTEQELKIQLLNLLYNINQGTSSPPSLNHLDKMLVSARLHGGDSLQLLSQQCILESTRNEEFQQKLRSFVQISVSSQLLNDSSVHQKSKHNESPTSQQFRVLLSNMEFPQHQEVQINKEAYPLKLGKSSKKLILQKEKVESAQKIRILHEKKESININDQIDLPSLQLYKLDKTENSLIPILLCNQNTKQTQLQKQIKAKNFLLDLKQIEIRIPSNPKHNLFKMTEKKINTSLHKKSQQNLKLSKVGLSSKMKAKNISSQCPTKKDWTPPNIYTEILSKISSKIFADISQLLGLTFTNIHQNSVKGKSKNKIILPQQ